MAYTDVTVPLKWYVVYQGERPGRMRCAVMVRCMCTVGCCSQGGWGGGGGQSIRIMYTIYHKDRSSRIAFSDGKQDNEIRLTEGGIGGRKRGTGLVDKPRRIKR